MKIIKEFKEFISRGSVIDMAIGIVIGTAFSAVVNSLVKDIIMPVIGALTTGMNFKEMGVTLSVAADGKPNILSYGNLINAVISFFIIAFCLFLVVKGINKVRNIRLKKEKDDELAKTELVKEAEALEEKEIDILKAILKELQSTPKDK